MDPAAEPVLDMLGALVGSRSLLGSVWVGRNTDVKVRVGGLFLTPSNSRGSIWVLSLGTGLTWGVSLWVCTLGTDPLELLRSVVGGCRYWS